MFLRQFQHSIRALILFAGISGLVSTSFSSAASNLSVDKPRIILDGKKSRDQFRIFNPTAEFQTYRVSVINMQMDENGNINEVEAFDSSAKDFLRVGPRMGKNIAPSQYQNFRVMLKRKHLKEAGEYRAHILMESLLPPVAEGEGSIVVRPNIRYSIPIIVRTGELHAKIDLQELTAEQTEDDKLRVRFAVTREGNRSIYGKVTARLAGGESPIFEAAGLGVYTELNKRYFSFTTDKNLPNSGELILSFEEDPDYGGTEHVEQRFALAQLTIKPYTAEPAVTTPTIANTETAEADAAPQ